MGKLPVPFCLTFDFSGITSGAAATVTQKNGRMEPLHIMGLSFASYSNAGVTRGTNWPFQVRTSGSDDFWFPEAIVPSLMGGSSDGYDTSNEASATVAFPWLFPRVSLAYGQEIQITAQNATGATSSAQFLIWGFYGDPMPAPDGRTIPGILVTPTAVLSTGVPSSQILYNSRPLPFIARDLVIARSTTVDNFNLLAQIVLSGAGVKVFSNPIHVSALNGPLEANGNLTTAGSAAGRLPWVIPGGGLLIPPSSQVEVQFTNLATNSSSAQAAFRGFYAA
ncbi:MAG: hypothetical protein E6R03_08395 [Hyphomicrobiaceae bacterium]|nr:MAG: hypothetical protein E6R03_08395 [Hyphomicrobiaceae bacterium]